MKYYRNYDIDTRSGVFSIYAKDFTYEGSVDLSATITTHRIEHPDGVHFQDYTEKDYDNMNPYDLKAIDEEGKEYPFKEWSPAMERDFNDLFHEMISKID